MYTFSRSMHLKRRCQNTKSLQNKAFKTYFIPLILKIISTHWSNSSQFSAARVHLFSYFPLVALSPSAALSWIWCKCETQDLVSLGSASFFSSTSPPKHLPKNNSSRHSTSCGETWQVFFQTNKPLEFSSGVCNSNRFQQLLMQNAIRMITYLPAFTFFQTHPTSC